MLLHGFTQTGRCWSPVDQVLADAGFEVTAPDLPGHGAAADEDTDLWGAARHVATAIEASGPTPVVLVGYSLGGRVALHLALDRPESVAALVLVGATPGIEDPTERATRRAADEALADRIERLGVHRFLDEWLAGPLFASLPVQRAHRPERELNTAAGLATSLRRCGTGTQEPLWERLHTLGCPTLVVTGGLDTKFTALAERMSSRIGASATHLDVPGAGHAVHLEQPERFAALVLAWLAERQTGP